jgi:hypothetical protein
LHETDVAVVEVERIAHARVQGVVVVFQKLFLLSALACLLTSRFSMQLCGFYGRPQSAKKIWLSAAQGCRSYQG